MAEKDFRQLKGPDKAAILMLALGEEHSSKIWPLLDDEEIKEISQNMANLGTINSEIVEKLFLEFVNNFSSTGRSEEHTSELQSLMRISYAVFCLKKKKTNKLNTTNHNYN